MMFNSAKNRNLYCEFNISASCNSLIISKVGFPVIPTQIVKATKSVSYDD